MASLLDQAMGFAKENVEKAMKDEKLKKQVTDFVSDKKNQEKALEIGKDLLSKVTGKK